MRQRWNFQGSRPGPAAGQIAAQLLAVFVQIVQFRAVFRQFDERHLVNLVVRHRNLKPVAELHQRIEKRFDMMLDAGFLDEVRSLREWPELRDHPAPLDLPAIRAVGYRQAWEYLDGQGDADTFRERAIAATRQLAKRQTTWLRGRGDGVPWFDPGVQRAALDDAVGRFLA